MITTNHRHANAIRGSIGSELRGEIISLKVPITARKEPAHAVSLNCWRRVIERSHRRCWWIKLRRGRRSQTFTYQARLPYPANIRMLRMGEFFMTNLIQRKLVRGWAQAGVHCPSKDASWTENRWSTASTPSSSKRTSGRAASTTCGNSRWKRIFWCWRT